MGEEARHAGLFGTASDMMKYLQIILNNCTPFDSKYPQFSA